MSRNKISIVAAIALAAALTTWFMTRGGEEPEKPRAQSTETESREPIATSGDGQDSKKARRGNNSGELEVLFDDDPEGALRLEGQVITTGDLPVAGAIVSIDSRPPRFTKSEEDGSFFFDKLVGRNYELVARSEQGVAGPVTARLSETNEPVIMLLTAGGKVSVQVTATDKPAGVSGARVELRGIAVQSASTDASGIATFTQVPVDRFEVVAVAEGYAPQRSRIAISRPGASTDLRLELKAGARVAGIVIDHEGKPVEGARVIYRGASDWSQRANARLDGVLSDEEGRFAIDALPSGSFRFAATADGYAPGSSSLVSLDGENETTGVEVRMEASAVLRGRVLSKEGEAIPAARVRVGAKSEGMVRRRGGVRQTYTDDEGHYELGGLARKPHEAVAMHESASSDIQTVDLSVDPYVAEVELTLDVDGTIEGTVVDSNDEPIAGAEVSVVPDFRKGARRSGSDWRLRGMNRERTDSGGHFRVSGLQPDTDYRVRAVPGNSSNPGRAWLTEGEEARTGDKEVRIVLPADGGIKGKVAFADGEAPNLFTVSVGWRRGTPFSSKDGKFELGEMPPRSFTVTVTGPGFDQKKVSEVEVAEGEFTDLGTITVSKGRVVNGVVLDPNGSPVQGAVVSAGRVIFGDGSSAKAGGRARNPMARSTKTTESDENGAFSISGVGLGDLSVVADHETLGRSLAFTLRQSDESIVGLTLALQKTGALEGVVSKGGSPVPDVPLSATSVSAPGVTFNVASGPDGSYRFDRLVPDRYRVKAMFGAARMSGMSFYAEQVDIAPEATARLDIDIQTGGTTLTVNLLAADGELGFSRVVTVAGAVDVQTARELDAIVGTGTGFEGMSFSIAGQPAIAENLVPGSYSVCAVVFPSEVTGMGGTIDYMNREGDNLPAICELVEIGEGPEQSMQMEITIPEYVPLPGADGPGDSPDTGE